MTPFELSAAAYRMSFQMIHRLCNDLTEEEFHHQPVPGANSAAWIVGHLAVTNTRFGARYGATGMPELGEDFIARFKATRQSAGDQSALGTKAELLSVLDATAERLMEAVRRLPPEALSAPLPTPAPAVVTNSAEMMIFGSMHIMMHVGQLSTIRRSLGKPPLM
jgi:uncharacterized damage-inducible protein DinB